MTAHATARRAGLAALLAAVAATGCQSIGALKTKAYDSTRAVLTSSYDDPQAEQKVAIGEELLAANDFDKARLLFADVASNTTNPTLLAEKARYHEAECYRNLRKYPEAVDTYHKMLVDFPGGAYRERACTQIFAIADYWLDDTREEIRTAYEGKSTTPLKLARTVKFDRSKPTLDQEGRAMQALEYVHTHDLTGPNADKALYWAGYVNFYRGNYSEADHFFSLLVETQKDSPLVPKAIELAVISKNNSTGGPQYDGQKAAEALQLVHHTEATRPEFRDAEKSEFLGRQKLAIRQQQAEKDFKMAEYYERSSHPGSAYFYYSLVVRRYPGTKLADRAAAKCELLKAHANDPPKPEPMDAVRETWNRMLGREAPTPQELPAAPRPVAPSATIPDGTGR